MDNSDDQPKKCFCARCFLPIESGDKVEVEGQNFHRMCCTCCVCRTIPTSLKMFYGHVFCNECFKTFVLNRFKGQAEAKFEWNRPHCEEPQEEKEKGDKEKSEETKPTQNPSEPSPKRCICARCLQSVEDNNKVDIGGQSFHTQCARCCCCHCVPKYNVKIYYGQVFCEECFHRHVLNRSKDNPSEFFKTCFDQWQNNSQFTEQMKEFMSSSNNCPLMFMMQGSQPPFCRCGTSGPQQECFQENDTRKSDTQVTMTNDGESLDTCDLTFEIRTEGTEPGSCFESANQENIVTAAEKIAKLTKYLHENSEVKKSAKKWQNFIEVDKSSMTMAGMPSSFCSWVDLQDPKIVADDLICPKCLWQCGPIFVTSEYVKKVCSGDGSSFE